MIRIYFKIIRGQWKTVLLYYIINLMLHALQPLQLLLSKKCVKSLSEYSITSVIFCIVFISTLMSIKSIYLSILTLLKKKIDYNISQVLYTQLYRDVTESNILYFNSAEFNTEIQQAKTAIDEKISALIYSISDIVGALISLCSISIIIIRIHYVYLLILIIMTIVQNVFVWLNADQAIDLIRKQNKLQRKYDYYMDLLQERSNAKEIRAYCLFDWIEEKRKEIFEKMKDLDCAFNKKWAVINSIWATVMFGLEGGIYLFLLYQYTNKSIKVENAIVIIESITLFIGGVIGLLDLLAAFPKNQIYVNSLYSIKKEQKLFYNEKRIKNNNVIELKNICFSYGQKHVLNNINFNLKRDEILGIVGENGAGKSTLINILIGLYSPEKGEIIIAGDNKQTVVFQDFAQFLFSIKENIEFGDIHFSNVEKIWNVLEKVELKNKINTYKHGLDTLLGKELYKDAEDLSGGEWQRMAIARAEFRDAKIIIFDEPTSFLDALKEEKIFKMLKPIFKDKSVILITHRIGLLGLTDRVVFLKNGMIVEEGTHDELIRKRKQYYKFYYDQAKWYESEQL